MLDLQRNASVLECCIMYKYTGCLMTFYPLNYSITDVDIVVDKSMTLIRFHVPLRDNANCLPPRVTAPNIFLMEFSKYVPIVSQQNLLRKK